MANIEVVLISQLTQRRVVLLGNRSMEIKDRLKLHTHEFEAQGVKYLLVAHAAGLITCLSLLKDYEHTPRLKGIGVFVYLFGFGLIAAAAAYGALAYLVTRTHQFILSDEIRRRETETSTFEGNVTLSGYMWSWAPFVVTAVCSLLLLLSAIGLVMRRFSSL
jgi:hypothetical protein